MDAISAIRDFEQAVLSAIADAATSDALEQVRIEFLGKKKGRLRELQDLIGKVPPEDRPKIGQQFNTAKTAADQALSARQLELAQPKKKAAQEFDITLPGAPLPLGKLHPLTQTMNEFKEIMGRFGFSSIEGPELEDERHNFEALNIPHDHPARDTLENFYLAAACVATGEPMLMRSQTSTVQIRVMEQQPPPVRVVSLGRVYRPDTIDATHSCMFHQMEGLMIGDDVTMAQLKTVLRLFATTYLGQGVHIRFRPSFFPFTEPSVEVDMSWKDGWLEIGGAGMVDPNVLEAVGYDPEQVTGFAFGLGVERFCMRRYQVNDIRRFTENDVRFLRQF
ncbi:MAG: phenylalanine--tRNA ligase subunit alpha [Planctomycetota bacterium]|nr:phenylalanine--tRNA ligase subunit alpha [Planctomycetota bacterium]MDA1212814.1 phenylalanine--tRNA ligase subunit alpha [Planctomycetota bacterium]